VTAAEVQRVAKKWLSPAGLRIVVTGDKATLEKGLSAFGDSARGAEAIEVRDAYGDLVK
jgi:hypothetical protein